jgi:hypothetical protein
MKRIGEKSSSEMARSDHLDGYKSAGSWLVQKDQLCLDTEKNQAEAATRFGFPEKNVELRNQASTVPLEAVLQKPAQGR